MTDIFFMEPDDMPVGPTEIKVRKLTAAPYPDGRRVKIELDITPFQYKPNIDVQVFNQAQKLVSSFSIVEAMQNRMDFTMHLREKQTGGVYTCKVVLFYNDLDRFELGERDSAPAQDILDSTREEMNHFEIQFDLHS